MDQYQERYLEHIENKLNRKQTKHSYSDKARGILDEILLNRKSVRRFNSNKIDDKILDSIFEPFKVGDIDHHSKGIGISLAICKKIVNIHSGDIKIESKIGKGTKVTIDLAKIEGGAK